MNGSGSADADADARDPETQGQTDPLSMVTQLTASREAMSTLGSALAGPIMESLRAAGVIAAPGQPRMHQVAGSVQQPPWPSYAPEHAGFQTRAPCSSHLQIPMYDSLPMCGYTAQPPPPRPTHPNVGPTPPSDPMPQQQMGPGPSDSGPSQPGSSRQSCSSVMEDEEEEEGEDLQLHPGWDDELEQAGEGEVDDTIATFVRECVAKPASNQQRKKWIDAYPLPKLQEISLPQMDMTLRLLVSKEVLSHDLWLKKLQALSMDAAGPLIHLLQQQVEGPHADPEVTTAVKQALSLMGNFFARLTKERRRKALLGLNKDLAHMADEDFEATGVLFGVGAIDRIEKRSGVLKSLRRVKQPFRGAVRRGKAYLGTAKRLASKSPVSEAISATRSSAIPLTPKRQEEGGKGQEGCSRMGVPQEAAPCLLSEGREEGHSPKAPSEGAKPLHQSYCTYQSIDTIISTPSQEERAVEPTPTSSWILATTRPLWARQPDIEPPLPPIMVEGRVLAGRLRLFLRNWQSLTKDSWVLSTIRGYEIPLFQTPSQKHPPVSVVSREENSLYLRRGSVTSREGCNRSDKGQPTGGFFLHIFTVPKKGGERRPIINLKGLNRFVAHNHFKMEGIPTLRDLITPGDFMFKLDLKDAYFTVPIHPSHRKYLRFRWKGEVYQFTCLPFGLSTAPHTFTKITKPVVSFLRGRGIRMVIYLDDMLFLHQEVGELVKIRHLTLDLLEGLGFLVNYQKSELSPSQCLNFLGFTINSKTMQILLPSGKVQQAVQEAQSVLQKQVVSARTLAHLIGIFSATIPAVLPAHCITGDSRP